MQYFSLGKENAVSMSQWHIGRNSQSLILSSIRDGMSQWQLRMAHRTQQQKSQTLINQGWVHPRLFSSCRPGYWTRTARMVVGLVITASLDGRTLSLLQSFSFQRPVHGICQSRAPSISTPHASVLISYAKTIS